MLVGSALHLMAQRYPNRPAIIYREHQLTYRDVNGMAVSLANGLLNHGYRKGDCVGVLSRKTPEMIIAYLAMGIAGLVGVPLSFHFRSDRIAGIASKVDMKLLIVDDAFQALSRELAGAGCGCPTVMIGSDRASGNSEWQQLTADSGLSSPDQDIQEDDVFYLNFTSGSTGEPKGVATTHGHIHWNTISSIEALGILDDDRHLCMFAAFSHPHEIFARPIWSGGTIVLLDSLYPKSIAAAISSSGVTAIMGLAPMYEMLIPFAASDRYDFSMLRLAESGGMVTTQRLQGQFAEAFGRSIRPVWGSTETTGVALAVPEGAGVTSSCGRPAPYYNIKIVDGDGNEVSSGETGEMIIQGPAVVQGYIRDDEESSRFFRNGWFHSGDMVYIDDDGLFSFRGRASGMMKVGGLKVFPMEIENTIRSLPEIDDVVVVPEYEKLRGEVPLALITIREGETIGEQRIRDHCRQHLPNYMIPKRVEVRQSLAKTPSGKIDRLALIEELQAGSQPAESEELRHRIEKIDLKILQLLNERTRASLRLREIRQREGGTLFNPVEDEETITRILGHNSGPLHDEFLEQLFQQLLQYLTMIER